MEKTPIAFRTHVSIFGDTNAGKSTLFNKLIGEDIAIVADKAGTTTDPVTKAFELIGYGPVALTDTAGLNDKTNLSDKRLKKTEDVLLKTDFAIYVSAVNSFNEDSYNEAAESFNKFKISHLLVLTKSDLLNEPKNDKYPDAVFVSDKDDKSIDNLREVLSNKLLKINPSDESIIKKLLPPSAFVLHVIPIDKEAPKGRLILPQVMTLRDCLDNGFTQLVVRDTELKSAIEKYGDDIDLVITDSQIFPFVADIVPKSIPLTSYSMLLAGAKGDMTLFTEGVKAIDGLHDGSKILIAEACSHSTSHEDIGRVKIPNILKKKTGKELIFEHYAHYDFPKNLSDYDLIIHCGGCMINQKAMTNRIEFARDMGVPITNYGVVLAYASGILERAKEIFFK